MTSQNNNYWSSPVNINNERYNYSALGKELGNRTITSQVVGGKRYFSSLDSEIYFGEEYIDEIVQIQWAIEQSTLPLFGYNSYTFDDVAIGARQITGTFMINFTKANFIYEILESVAAVSRSSFNSSEDYGGQIKWDSFFDKEHSSAWNKSFNIRVGYGDYNKKIANSTSLVLHCVQLTGCQQVIGLDGSPIGEVYSFIAKDIRHEEAILEKKYVEDIDEKNNLNPEQSFVFAINSSSIEQILPGSNEINDIKNYGYKIKINYESFGGDIKSISIKLKRSDSTYITPSSIKLDLNKNKSIAYILPSQYRAAIDKEFILQNKLSIEEQYLLIDYTIDYNLLNQSEISGSISKSDQRIILEK